MPLNLSSYFDASALAKSLYSVYYAQRDWYLLTNNHLTYCVDGV